MRYFIPCFILTLIAVHAFAQDANKQKTPFEQCNAACLTLPDPSANFNQTHHIDEQAMLNRKKCFDNCKQQRAEENRKQVQAEQDIRDKAEQEDRAAREKAALASEQDAEKEQQRQQKEESDKWAKIIGEKTLKLCNHSVYSTQQLLAENPYDVGGKCYLLSTFSASNIQILSRSIGLIMYQDQVVYADFSKQSAPVHGQSRAFVVKGDSKPFKYKSASGGAVTAIKVHVLKEITDESESIIW